MEREKFSIIKDMNQIIESVKSGKEESGIDSIKDLEIKIRNNNAGDVIFNVNIYKSH